MRGAEPVALSEWELRVRSSTGGYEAELYRPMTAESLRARGATVELAVTELYRLHKIYPTTANDDHAVADEVEDYLPPRWG